MSAQELETIISQVERLSPLDQLQLIRRVAEMLANASKAQQPRRLIYGEFRDASRMSTEEDFKIAEWHPTEKDLDGP
ncbi:MAG: hypothetical protein AB1631_01785 [Acidobacteriota bacterium]